MDSSNSTLTDDENVIQMDMQEDAPDLNCDQMSSPGSNTQAQIDCIATPVRAQPPPQIMLEVQFLLSEYVTYKGYTGI